MTEYQCGNCRETSRLGPNPRFCPYCGSTSLNLVIKEDAAVLPGPGVAEVVEIFEEVRKPRRRKQASE